LRARACGSPRTPTTTATTRSTWSRRQRCRKPRRTFRIRFRIAPGKVFSSPRSARCGVRCRSGGRRHHRF
jgi:hypothetical protein